MLTSIKIVFHQVIETLAEHGVKGIFHPRVFWNRRAIPVEMDLLTVNLPLAGQLNNAEFKFFEITMDDLRSGKWTFAVPSRGLKAVRNLKRGYRGFVVAKDSTIVGDLWCIAPRKGGKPIYHPDLRMLDIVCGIEDAYAFDMLIPSTYRGKNLAVPLQKTLQSALKMEGYQRVYGYFWEDNLPALWMHRMLKFKELPKRRVSRFFFLVRSQKEVV